MLNKIGPKTDHCGIPFISIGQNLKDLLIFVLCQQLDM